jgi:phosphate starvation-inducible membrane PsiE
MPKLVKNVEYYAPIAILLGLVFYPLNYFAFLHVVGDYFQFNTLLSIAYFIAMPVTGMIAFQFVQYLKSTSFKWKYVFHISNQNEALKELRKLQNDLKKIITVQ